MYYAQNRAANLFCYRLEEADEEEGNEVCEEWGGDVALVLPCARPPTLLLPPLLSLPLLLTGRPW